MARQKKPADAVQFTRESAERVARVVRSAELTPSAASPLTFGRRPSDMAPKQVLRFAYYTATTNWTVAAYTAATTTNDTKVIQFASPTSTPFQTALCVNHLASMPRLTTVATNALMMVVAFKDGKVYKLIGAQS